MKTILLPAIAALFFLGAFSAVAQEPPPARILPGLAPPPIPAPVDPPEDFPEIMPGDPGEFFMPEMPGRYQIISAQIQQNGKALPIVLKLDTQTGQVWHLTTVTSTVLHNGKKRAFTRFAFEPVDPHEHPQPLPDTGPDRPDEPGFGIEGNESSGEAVPREAPRVEPGPERLSIDG